MPTLGEMLLWRYAVLITLIVAGVVIGFVIRKLRHAIDRPACGETLIPSTRFGGACRNAPA